MLKLYISLCLALVVGTLTLTNGILHDARMSTVAYRVLVSFLLFGVIGYALGFMGEKFYKELIDKIQKEHPQEDVSSEENTDEEVVSESESESEFSPFASDNFEQISRPKE